MCTTYEDKRKASPFFFLFSGQSYGRFRVFRVLASVSSLEQIMKKRACFPFVGWCMINTVKKKKSIQIRSFEWGVDNQPIWQHLGCPTSYIWQHLGWPSSSTSDILKKTDRASHVTHASTCVPHVTSISLGTDLTAPPLKVQKRHESRLGSSFTAEKIKVYHLVCFVRNPCTFAYALTYQ